jgi:hypothetical protein
VAFDPVEGAYRSGAVLDERDADRGDLEHDLVLGPAVGETGRPMPNSPSRKLGA